MGDIGGRPRLRRVAAIVLGLVLACGEASAGPERATARTVQNLTAQAVALLEGGRESEALASARKAYELGRTQLGEDVRPTLEAGEQLGRLMRQGQEKQSFLGGLSSAATARFGPDDPLSLRLRRAFAFSVGEELRGGYADAVRLKEVEALFKSLADDTARLYGPRHIEAVRAQMDLGRYYLEHTALFDSRCDRLEPARRHLSAALDMRRDEDIAPQAGKQRPIEDFLLVALGGFVAEVYEDLADCAEGENRAEDIVKFRALRDSYKARQFAEVRKFLGPRDPLREAFAGMEAEFHAKAGRKDEARRIARELAMDARRRGRDDSPAIIETELKYLDCPPGKACSPEAHQRIGELVQAALRFGKHRRPDPYEFYAFPFLAEKFRYIDKGAWLSATDAILARSIEVRLKYLGVSDAEYAAHLHYEFRRDTPQYVDKAVEPARIKVAAIRAKLAARGASLQANADVSRARANATSGFLALAETAWTAGGSAEAGGGPLSDEAYRAIQDSMAGSVSSALALSAAQRAAGERGLSQLAQRRSELADTWLRLDADFVRAASNPRGGQVDDLRRRRDEAGREAAEIDRRLRSEFPDYFQFLNPEPLDVRATQALLAPDEAILLVVPGNRGGAQIMAIGGTEFAWRRSSLERHVVEDMVDRLLWLSGADVKVSPEIRRRWTEEAGPGLPFNRKLAFELYGQLVAPVEPVLKGKRHVFVVSGGSLSRLPFGILVTAPPTGADSDPAALRSTAWFGDAHALAVIPSIRSLHLLRKRGGGGSAGTSFAGFGDPVLAGDAETRGGRSASRPGVTSVFVRGAGGVPTGKADVRALRSLARLPGTAVELENMRRLLDAPESAVRLGDRATETAVKDADLSGVRVVAFATHGLIAGELQGGSEPGLVLTPPSEATDKDDGLLAASEVAALRLAADWVILSACNTAAGGSSEAAGLSGLARAFFHAGARSLLVSHWPVRDDVASVITVEAIRLQRETPGLSRAEATRQAMRRIRDDTASDKAGDTWAHPNAWAAFSLIGDGAEARQER